jgi:hypothetical protein
MADFTTVVQRHMTERGMSLRGLAKAAHYDPSTLSKVLNGLKPVTPYLAACLDRALEARGEITAAAASAATDDTRLRLRELADHAAELGQWAETGNAGPGTIAMLDEEIDRISREYAGSPPGPLILRASITCRRVSTLLKQHQRLRHARDLYVVGARCCAFLSVALGDLGRQGEAGAYARTALTLAEEAADPAAVAVALSALSKVAFWDGRRQHAADLAARGYDLARADDDIRVLLACQQADASPVRAARRALELAERARDEITGDGTGLFSAGRVRVACYTMTLSLREGDIPGVLAAATAADNACRDGEEPPFGSWAQVQISAALALLATGEPDAAGERLAAVLDLPAGMRLATFAGKLDRAAVLASAPPYGGNQAAQGLAEHIRSYLGQEDNPMPYPLALGPDATP